MFRVHAQSGVLVYDTFMNASLNHSTATPEELVNSTAWYKSPLFDSIQQLSVSEVHLELLHPNRSLAVKLTFAMTGTRLQEEKAWFSRENLLTAFPWNVSEMQAINYNFFTMRGSQTLHYHRSFYISNEHHDCSGDKGFLMIKGNVSSCKWENETKFYPPYLWNPNAKSVWESNAQEAAELLIFVIIGLKEEQMTIYHRRSIQV